MSDEPVDQSGLRYAKEQGQVWVSVAKENNKPVWRVADNGAELTTDQLTSIFELFVQADHSLARLAGHPLRIDLHAGQPNSKLHEGGVIAHSKRPGTGQRVCSTNLPLAEQPEMKRKDSTESSAGPPPQAGNTRLDY